MRMEGFLTTKEAAGRLKVSDGRIRQMIIAKVITGAQKFGGVHVIPEAEIQRLEKLDRKAGRPFNFDLAASIAKFNDPIKIMSAWFVHEGREYPQDYGVVFFNGWESFDETKKLEALQDAKRVLDRSLEGK